MASTKPTLHRDGTITYWSVYRQIWVHRAADIPAKELAAMSVQDRHRAGSRVRGGLNNDT